ncbi:MAG: MarR family winged helix-turn-helix transcriptional regulator [Gemmatimonadaceae bacterium]
MMFALLDVARALGERLDDALTSVGLSPAKYGVLQRLVEAGRPLALSELAEVQSCVRSNMTQLVDRLEADGLVRRVDDPADRRVVRAELTRLGAARQREGAQRVRRVEAEFADALPAADRAAFARALRALR